MKDDERRERHATARQQYRDVVDASHLPEIIKIGGIGFTASEKGLRYGLAPGTAARLYRQDGFYGASVPNAIIVQMEEKILSYANIEDMDTGLNLMLDLELRFPGKKFAAIMKHAIPFAVSRADSLIAAYSLAWGVDPIIPFGGTLAFNDVVNGELAERIAGTFVDGIIAKDFDADARSILARKKDLRLMALPELYEEGHCDHGYEIKSIEGGLLVAERYKSKTVTREDIVVRSENKTASDEMLDTALLQWCVLGYVRSNAAVFGDCQVTYGVGSGQGSRVDAIENALSHAAKRCPFLKQQYHVKPFELVLATDGFPPEVDSVEVCAQYGAQGFMSPIGSLKDNKVYNRAVDLGLILLTPKNNERPFTHR